MYVPREKEEKDSLAVASDCRIEEFIRHESFAVTDPSIMAARISGFHCTTRDPVVHGPRQTNDSTCHA